MSGPRVVAFARPEPTEVIEFLESLIERARRGEIMDVAVALATGDGSFATAWTFQQNSGATKFQLLSAVSMLQSRLYRAVDEQGG